MYSIEFMNDNEFEQLPYRDMGDKIGVCDRNRGKVYVRKSGAKVMDALTAMHEIEHMEKGDWGKHANHQDREMAGVYYKGFGDIFNTIAQAASFIPSPVQPLAATYSAANGAKQAITGSNMFGGGGVQKPQQSQPMQQFQPQAQQPQTPQTSVINPGGVGGQGGAGSIPSSGGISQDALQKLRATWGGQTPQQGMPSFGSGNTPFGGV